MTEHVISKEQRILRVMRKVLTGIIRDTTPQPGMLHVLSDRTIEDIRECLGLITTREKELADEAGTPMNERPYYVDEERHSHVVSLSTLRRKKRGDKDKGDS